MVVGQRIQSARKAKGWTQKELADRLDLATGTVQQYELGKRSPSIDTLQAIARLLSTSVDALTSTAEPDDEYEMIIGVLELARIKVDPSGFNSGGGSDGDTLYIYHADDPEPIEEREEIEYKRLAEIIHKVLADSEDNKRAYIRKRLEAELF